MEANLCETEDDVSGKGKLQQQPKGAACKESKEGPVVGGSNARVQPHAVMVEVVRALVAQPAVLTSLANSNLVGYGKRGKL